MNFSLQSLVLLCFVFQHTFLLFEQVVVALLLMLDFLFQYNHFTTLDVSLLEN